MAGKSFRLGNKLGNPAKHFARRVYEQEDQNPLHFKGNIKGRELLTFYAPERKTLACAFGLVSEQVTNRMA